MARSPRIAARRQQNDPNSQIRIRSRRNRAADHSAAVGYMLIEHMSVLDAFYMSVITISTVGFGEAKPLSPAGRLFTIGLIVTGVGSAIYLFSVIGELVVEGRLREFLGKRAMNRRIHGLTEHIIVCGFGRFGRAVVEELIRNAVPMVVIEMDPTRQAELDTASVLYVVGSALEDSVLAKMPGSLRPAR